MTLRLKSEMLNQTENISIRSGIATLEVNILWLQALVQAADEHMSSAGSSEQLVLHNVCNVDIKACFCIA